MQCVVEAAQVGAAGAQRGGSELQLAGEPREAEAVCLGCALWRTLVPFWLGRGAKERRQRHGVLHRRRRSGGSGRRGDGGVRRGAVGDVDGSLQGDGDVVGEGAAEAVGAVEVGASGAGRRVRRHRHRRRG